jgi:predicted ATPase with chaperone activity
MDAYLVEVELYIGPSYQGNSNLVGLPDIAVKESPERIESALGNCGFDFRSNQAVTVNRICRDTIGYELRRDGRATVLTRNTIVASKCDESRADRVNEHRQPENLEFCIQAGCSRPNSTIRT